VLRTNILCVVIALSAAPAVSADELSETGDFLDGVAAIVNEGVVLKSQFERHLATIRANAEKMDIPLPPDDILEEQVLEQLILAEIQLQRADRIGLTQQISDQVVNQAIARVANQNGVPFNELPRFLAEDGIIYAEFRATMRDEITINELKGIEVTRNIHVSEREIEQCLADLDGNVVANSDWELSHILLTMPESATSEQIEEVETQANLIYERLQDGADFRQLAARYSAGPTALEGGSLGWLDGQQIPTIFTDVLQDMSSGDIAPPIRTASSFHIVKVDSLRLAVERSEIDQVKVRHILITPNEIIDDETAQQRLDDALEKIRGGEDFAEQAKLLSDDPGSANLGGDLGWSQPGDYVPEFTQAVADAEIGVVTEPFRSYHGWHILEVLERRVYDNTEDLKESNCLVRIRMSKQDEETQLWRQRLRDGAFVESRI